MEQRWWKRPSALPLALLVMALLIIVVGGSIRINDAGESCPEWPTCFGEWHFVVSEDEQATFWDANPDQVDSRGEDHRYTIFQIFVEWFHRLLVGIIAIPIIANSVISWKNRSRWGSGISTMAQTSAALLLVQASVGYITVRYDNADWTVALHLSLASIFASMLLWQWMAMRVQEGVKWTFLNAPKSFVQQHSKRSQAMMGAVGILLILGAWVSSSAGGQYNQSCSVGFPTGWPKCQGNILPSLDGPGIFIQLIHRSGALLVGLVLILGLSKLRTTTEGDEGAMSLTRTGEVVAGLWLLNVMVGGSYIVFAKIGDFPEWLSLLHLVIGVAAFLSAVFLVLSMRFAASHQSDSDGEA